MWCNKCPLATENTHQAQVRIYRPAGLLKANMIPNFDFHTVNAICRCPCLTPLTTLPQHIGCRVVQILFTLNGSSWKLFLVWWLTQKILPLGQTGMYKLSVTLFYLSVCTDHAWVNVQNNGHVTRNQGGFLSVSIFSRLKSIDSLKLLPIIRGYYWIFKIWCSHAEI